MPAMSTVQMMLREMDMQKNAVWRLMMRFPKKLAAGFAVMTSRVIPTPAGMRNVVSLSTGP